MSTSLPDAAAAITRHRVLDFRRLGRKVSVIPPRIQHSIQLSVLRRGELAAGTVDLLATGITQSGGHASVVEPVDELLHHIG